MGCTQSRPQEGQFEDQYQLGKQLGQGNFSIVVEGTHRISGELYAVKVFNKKNMNKDDMADLAKEIKVLKMMNHKNIIRYFGDFQDHEYFYLVLELMQGGNLLDRIQTRESYMEVDARNTCKQIVEAVGYCHSRQIVHRDIKPDNMLLMGRSIDSEVKLGDFGFSSIMVLEGGLKTVCGTPHFVAPEIIMEKSYGYAVDMWSLGVCTFLLLSGNLPFDDADLSLLYRKICRKKVVFDDTYWSHVSSEAKNFISLLLTVNPKERITAKEALEHSWLKSDHVGSDYHLSDNLEQLRAYNLKRKLRAAVYTVIATNKLTSLGLGHQRRIAVNEWSGA